MQRVMIVPMYSEGVVMCVFTYGSLTKSTCDPVSIFEGFSIIFTEPSVLCTWYSTFGTVVIGLLRRALPRIRQALSLDPGGLRAFLFRLDAPLGGWPEPTDAQGALLIPLSTEDPTAAVRIEPGLLPPRPLIAAVASSHATRSCIRRIRRSWSSSWATS